MGYNGPSWNNVAASAKMSAAAPRMLAFIEDWLEEILGGESGEALTGWQADFVTEAKDVISKATD
jgi:uncharacterized membrane protein YjdF